MTTTRMLNERGDYEVLAGDIQEEGTETSTVLWLLTTERGSCPIYPNAGNRMASISKLDGDSTRREIEQAAVEALAPLVVARRISNVKATAVVSGSNVSVDVSFVDVASAAEQKVSARLGG